MNNLAQDKKDTGKVRTASCGAVTYQDMRRPDEESQMLQEIIDILKHPFQTSCETCNGLGFIRSSENCYSCQGTGKVIDKFFK